MRLCATCTDPIMARAPGTGDDETWVHPVDPARPDAGWHRYCDPALAAELQARVDFDPADLADAPLATIVPAPGTVGFKARVIGGAERADVQLRETGHACPVCAGDISGAIVRAPKGAATFEAVVIACDAGCSAAVGPLATGLAGYQAAAALLLDEVASVPLPDDSDIEDGSEFDGPVAI